MSQSSLRVLILACLLAAVSSCYDDTATESCEVLGCNALPSTAHGTFRAKAGTHLTGTVQLAQEGSAVSVVVDVQGASPGPHGIHIHARGDCSAADFSSAGAHFNPTGAPHTCPPTEPRHAGDLGNIDVGSDGTGHLELSTSDISLAPGPSSVIGLAVILHDAADDCISQPSGGSGTRVGCALLVAP